VIRATPNANRATWDDRTPESMNAGKQTNKILPVKPNPAQPMKLIFLHLNLNAKN
jgi:hypothetical protein